MELPEEYIVPVGQLNSKLSLVSSYSPRGASSYPRGVTSYPRGVYSLPRPNPSISNKGLVIVQEYTHLYRL